MLHSQLPSKSIDVPLCPFGRTRGPSIMDPEFKFFHAIKLRESWVRIDLQAACLLETCKLEQNRFRSTPRWMKHVNIVVFLVLPLFGDGNLMELVAIRVVFLAPVPLITTMDVKGMWTVRYDHEPLTFRYEYIRIVTTRVHLIRLH